MVCVTMHTYNRNSLPWVVSILVSILLPCLQSRENTPTKVHLPLPSTTFDTTTVTTRDTANTGNIYCFGDSWANYACPSLQTVIELNLKPNKVINKGFPGTTATLWANQSDLMLAELLSDGLPSFIYLSLSGNDILDGWANNVCVGNYTTVSAMNCYGLIYTALDTILDTIISTFPLVQIVQFGYDFTNFLYNTECLALLLAEFHGLGQPDVNRIFYYGLVDNVLQNLTQKYNRYNYQYVSLWGTLQKTGGTGITPLPYPNLDYPSPEEYLNNGCIHANTVGWDILMEALYTNYFTERL